MDFREADQTEKAYQKQDGVFIGRKKVLGKKSKLVRSIFSFYTFIFSTFLTN